MTTDPQHEVPTSEPRPAGGGLDPTAASRTPSAVKLRVGVALVILWLVPLWWLSPLVVRLIGVFSDPPSVVVVTTSIVVLQTVLGLLGLVVAGPQVKTLVKGAKVRRAIPLLWRVLTRGELPPAGAAEDPPASTAEVGREV